MKSLLFRIAVLVVMFTLVAVYFAPPSVSSGVTEIGLCDSLRNFSPLWVTEIQRLYPNAVVVFGHGGDVDGVWSIRADRVAVSDKGEAEIVPLPAVSVRSEIMLLQLQYPGRVIVLVVCNPQHHLLHGVHGVVYADRDVWAAPDWVETPVREALLPDFAVGSIDQFIYVR